MTKLNNIFDRHVVTGGEAAAAGIFGVYQAQTRWQWQTALSVRDEQEDWLLEALECYHSNAAGLDRQGRVINLVALPPPGQTIHFLARNTRCQYLGARVGLAYPQHINNGFAVHMCTPALITGDIIIVTGLYRVVHHGR